jgi:hypothetical protein
MDSCHRIRLLVLGGAEEGVHGRETESKAIVAVAAEEDGRRVGPFTFVGNVGIAIHSFCCVAGCKETMCE